MRELRAHPRRNKFTQWLVCGVVTGLAACEGSPATSTTAVPSTVTAPEAPPPCDVGALTFSAVESSAIRIRNDAAMQCEVDVFESELADPFMEPDVWLDAGAEAEVLVEATGETCAAPSALTSIELVVNGRSVEVPIAIPATCGVVLSAIYQVEHAG